MTPLMTIDAANDQRVRRPRSVTSVAALQLLIAAAFLSVPVADAVYGGDVRAAAGAVRQGLPLTAVTASDLRLGGSRTTTVLLVVAALALVPLSLLNLHGRRVGRMLSWIVLPVAFVGNLFLAGGRTTVRSGHREGLRRIDAQALLDAAHGARPGWVSSLPDVRFGVVVAAGLLAVALLAAPSARRYFREDEEVEWLDI